MYAAVEAIAPGKIASTHELCDVLQVSRSAFYAWRSAKPTSREEREMRLAPQVRQIFHEHKRRYGARRVADELRDRGEPCSPRLASKLLKMQGLKAIGPKSFKPRTTQSRHRLGFSPNLLLDHPKIQRTNRLYVGDITYVGLEQKRFCYLALLMDWYSRRIVGWKLGEDLTDELVIAALTMAIRDRQPPRGLLHHTDRGGQYASHAYRAILRRAAMRQSMSRADDCYDNAFMESCFGTIKTELEMTDYPSIAAAHIAIRDYIGYYNHDRKHSSLGYLKPAQYEKIKHGQK